MPNTIIEVFNAPIASGTASAVSTYGTIKPIAFDSDAVNCIKYKQKAILDATFTPNMNVSSGSTSYGGLSGVSSVLLGFDLAQKEKGDFDQSTGLATDPSNKGAYAYSISVTTGLSTGAPTAINTATTLVSLAAAYISGETPFNYLHVATNIPVSGVEYSSITGAGSNSVFVKRVSTGKFLTQIAASAGTGFTATTNTGFASELDTGAMFQLGATVGGALSVKIAPAAVTGNKIYANEKFEIYVAKSQVLASCDERSKYRTNINVADIVLLLSVADAAAPEVYGNVTIEKR